MISAVIFDLDGTLVESAADLHAGANAMLAELGAEPIDLPTITSCIGHGMDALVSQCLHKRGIDPLLLAVSVTRFKALYEAQGYALTKAFPGVADALGELKAQGLRLGVCTNKDTRPARAILGACAIERFFDAVIGGDAFPSRKPDPAALWIVADACGADPDGVLYVGDSEVDAETALRAGVPFVLFTEGYRKAPITDLKAAASFSHYEDLVSSIARALK